MLPSTIRRPAPRAAPPVPSGRDRPARMFRRNPDDLEPRNRICHRLQGCQRMVPMRGRRSQSPRTRGHASMPYLHTPERKHALQRLPPFAIGRRLAVLPDGGRQAATAQTVPSETWKASQPEFALSARSARRLCAGASSPRPELPDHQERRPVPQLRTDAQDLPVLELGVAVHFLRLPSAQMQKIASQHRRAASSSAAVSLAAAMICTSPPVSACRRSARGFHS